MLHRFPELRPPFNPSVSCWKPSRWREVPSSKPGRPLYFLFTPERAQFCSDAPTIRTRVLTLSAWCVFVFVTGVDVAPKCPRQKASFSPLSCTRGSRGRMRTGPSRTSKSAAPYGHPAGSRVSQRDALHPSTPRCESIWRRRSATANSTLTRRTCAECPPRGCPCIVCLVAS